MNILVLNWRDIKNPASGGSEILTQELAKRLVKKGHSVTQFSSYFAGAKKNEIVEGVKILRKGKPDARHLFSSVHFEALRYYKSNEDKFDLVVDEVHGIPFFTPFYVRAKKIALICEVAGEIWDITFPFPFNYLGRMIERIYPKFYKSVKVVTISKSSKRELEHIGFSKNNISVISLGCNVPIVSNLNGKNSTPTLIFVSRLTKSKGIEDAIKSIKIVKEKFNDVKLNIVGRGELHYVKKLKNMVSVMGLEKNIEFLGFVSEKEKWSLLEKSHILLSPSSKEGWGLTVHEAGARGTPAVVYNVEGLRDVVINGGNGIICNKNNYGELAKETIKLLSSKKKYKKLQEGAVSERKRFSWDRTTDEFIKIIK